MTCHYPRAPVTRYVQSAPAFPPEFSKRLSGQTMTGVMGRWFKEELYLSTVSTAKEKRMKAKFANAIYYVCHFLPDGSHIRAKPHSGDIDEFSNWVNEIHHLASTAVKSALQFCEDNRRACGEDDGDDGSGPPKKKQRNRDITEAFHGMHKRLSHAYTHSRHLFVRPADVVVEQGCGPEEEDTDD